MTTYELWQKNRFGDILPDKPDETFEDTYEEDLRLAEFIETMNELQRMEDEN